MQITREHFDAVNWAAPHGLPKSDYYIVLVSYDDYQSWVATYEEETGIDVTADTDMEWGSIVISNQDVEYVEEGSVLIGAPAQNGGDATFHSVILGATLEAYRQAGSPTPPQPTKDEVNDLVKAMIAKGQNR